MYPQLQNYIKKLTDDFGTIPEARRNELAEVAAYISKELKKKDNAHLNFICTHNSRRSHLSQIWAQTAAAYYNIDNVKTYSGGTEATAFNPRAVASIERAGFQVKNPGGENPHYEVSYNDKAEPMICFSKKFDDPFNPSKGFAAIMTCSDADENCPFVPGVSFRKPITYRDPKESDGSAIEKETYDLRCKQIGTEMFYMLSKVLS
ncbi:MAG: protein-tyrosine-phosphatase [Balneolaceae bacterium]|nr:MAG: protein-tyrosine-phosphatase [Balneolaceae bacterium]